MMQLKPLLIVIVVLLVSLGVQSYRVLSLQKKITDIELELVKKERTILEKRSAVTRDNDTNVFFDRLYNDKNW